MEASEVRFATNHCLALDQLLELLSKVVLGEFQDVKLFMGPDETGPMKDRVGLSEACRRLGIKFRDIPSPDAEQRS